MSKVTLVGSAWARKGARFFNAESCEVAVTCPVAKACQGLAWNRSYEVVDVRPIRHNVCAVHEGGVQAVAVKERPIEASLEASKTRGTAVRWSPPICRFRGCANWDRCFPRGPAPGHEYVLEKTEGRLECPMGYDLVAVVLRDPGRGGPAA